MSSALSAGISRCLQWLIRGYQLFLSPLIGPRCRFYPSCSHYALEALRTHGWFRGSVLALRRLLRCHPWHAGGYDPVPTHLSNCGASNSDASICRIEQGCHVHDR